MGADFGSTIPLRIQTRANYPIDFSTANLFRARINPKMSYAIGTAPNAPRNGFTLLSGRPSAGNNIKGPFTRLHLVDDVGQDAPNVYAQDIGYRRWMRNGITFTGNSDQAYIGQKYSGSDNTDFVIQWSDNPDSHPWGTDRMKFLFSSTFTGAHTGMGSEYGLEAMRLWPKNEKEVNVGIGDFFAYGGDPTERLHVRDGRVRIQQLPDDPETNLAYKVMVVDATQDPLERGVVKWVDPANLPGSTGCDWTLMNSGISGPSIPHDVYTAVGTSDACPDATDAVGIGTSSPKAKLHVFTTKPNIFGNDVILGQFKSDQSGARGVRGSANSALSTTFSPYMFTGVQGLANNGKYTYGVEGHAANGVNSPGTAQDLIGLRGTATANNGNAVRTIGVYGRASGAAGGNDWAAWFDGQGFLGAAVWQYSDENLKQDITDLSLPETVDGLMQLHPKSYTFNTTEYPYLHLPAEPQLGLISQEVETVFPQLVKDVTRPAQEDSTGNIIEPELNFKAMNYVGLIPVLVAGFQQQQQMIDQQQATIAQLQAQIDQCCAAQNPGMAPEGEDGLKSAPAKENVQEQRLLIIPNPVADMTTLEYYVPQAGKVSLQVSTSEGKPLGTLREEQAEAGAYTYEWNTSKLASGTYFCTYMLDGAVVVKRAVKVAR